MTTGDILKPAEYPTYVVLGSGGHTAEMCRLTQALLQQDTRLAGKYQPIRFILASSDTTSERQLREVLPATAAARAEFVTLVAFCSYYLLIGGKENNKRK